MSLIAQEEGIQRVLTEEQIRLCHRVMQQLRPHLTEELAFIEQVQRQLTEGYHLAYWQDGGEVKALAGFRYFAETAINRTFLSCRYTATIRETYTVSVCLN